MQATSDEALIGRIAAGDKLAMHLLFARQNPATPHCRGNPSQHQEPPKKTRKVRRVCCNLAQAGAIFG